VDCFGSVSVAMTRCRRVCANDHSPPTDFSTLPAGIAATRSSVAAQVFWSLAQASRKASGSVARLSARPGKRRLSSASTNGATSTPLTRKALAPSKSHGASMSAPVRRHLAPGARLIFDVFNPSVRVLAQADGVRRRRDALTFVDPHRGVVHVDVAETYDAAAQVTRGRWYFSTDAEADFVVAPLEIRSIFPQELPLLLSLSGLRVVERFGDWSRGPLTADAALQLYVCEPD
jgi:hypothetical protein